jgi:HEAT repeat protein
MPVICRSLLFLLLLAPARAVTNEDCLRILQQALRDKNPDTRKEAVVALSLAVSRGPLLPELISMLDDKDVTVRLAAVTSLVEVKNKQSHDALSRALADKVPEVRFAAAKALWALRDPQGEEALRAVLQGETRASSGIITREKRQAAHMLHTPRALLLYVLIQGVGFAPVPGLGEGVASMQALLLDPKFSNRANAALLLGNDRDPAVVAALRDGLKDKDWSLRAASAHALALRNDPALQSALEPLLADPKQAVRLRAAAGFVRLSSFLSPSRK